MFGRRPDARLAEGIPTIRRFMPFISPRRNESLVYFAQDIDVESALEFVDRWNEGRPPDARITLFHLFLRALAIGLHDRPRLNRFTAGGRIWQRDGVWLSFSAKMRLDDDAPLITVKKPFPRDESLEDMVARLHHRIRDGRSGRPSTSDQEMKWLLRLPAFVIRAVLRLVRAVDDLGLLPRAMIEPDPMHASAFVANLGSVGLEAGYHHLWEYGNIPIFAVVGRIRSGPEGRRHMTVKWSYDERIEDGFYAARGLERVRDLLAKPEGL